MIDLPYFLSQFFTIVMYLLLAMTYFAKTKRRIFIINSLSLIANMIAYLLLNAWSGLAMVVIAMIRNICLLYNDRKNAQRNEQRSGGVLIAVYVAIIIAAIPTYNGFLSLFSVFATSLYTYSIWQKKTSVYKFLGIIVSILWIIYNAYVQSIFGIALEAVLLISSTAGYIKENRAKHTATDPPTNK